MVIEVVSYLIGLYNHGGTPFLDGSDPQPSVSGAVPGVQGAHGLPHGQGLSSLVGQAVPTASRFGMVRSFESLGPWRFPSNQRVGLSLGPLTEHFCCGNGCKAYAYCAS